MALSVTNSFTAVGNGPSLLVRNMDAFTYTVSGTWVGTVVLQKTKDGINYEPIVSLTGNATAVRVEVSTSDNMSASYRFQCSAFTSGTIVTALTESPKTLVEYLDGNGVTVFKVTEDGVTALSLVATSTTYPDGSAAAPSLAFTNDTDNGLYLFGTNSVGFATAGVTAGNIDASQNWTFVGVIKNANGTSTAPSITFASDLDLGIYRATTNALGISAGGIGVAGYSVQFSNPLSATAGFGIVMDVGTSAIIMSGGVSTASGAVFKLFGATHAAAANVFSFQDAATTYIRGNGDSTLTFGDNTLTALTIVGHATNFTGVVMAGTKTNNSAAAGNVGEYLQASRLKSAATGATSTTTLNVTASALSLTAGDWDVSGVVVFLAAATTSVTLLKSAISKTSATLPATDTIGVPTSGEVSAQISTAANIMTGDTSLQMPMCRISLASTTSIFLVANATFSVSTLTVYGSLNARRVR